MNENEERFDDEDEDPSGESLDDLKIGARNVSSAVVYNTDWTVETITLQVKKGAIDLNPSFQRRDAWALPKKSLLIESVLLNFPVPPLTLAEVGASKSYIVVDGKQRLMTLSQFFGLMPNSRNNGFKLTGLTELSSLNGLNIDGLSAQHPSYLRALENYPIRTNIIRGWHDDSILYSIFLRLNSGSVKLSPQELRQALIPGAFSEWLAEYTYTSSALRTIFPGTEPDFRMRDLELMLRYLGMTFFLENYRGNLKQFLDETAKTLNDDWRHWSPKVEYQAAIFERAFDAIQRVFSKQHAFRKWTGKRWERRLNRAVFDVMMYYLKSETHINAFIEADGRLVEQFRSLCESDQQFREAIESTTKSVNAVGARLNKWGAVLNDSKVTTELVALSSDGRIVIHGST